MTENNATPPTLTKRDAEAIASTIRHHDLRLPYRFTPEEMLSLGKKLAEAATSVREAQDEKKAVTKQLSAKIDGATATVNEITSKIQSGYEYRLIRCTTALNIPKPGRKTTVRLDTYETVEVEDMTEHEKQMSLPLEAPTSPVPETSPTVLAENEEGVVGSVGGPPLTPGPGSPAA
jgi:hypothetical protein